MLPAISPAVISHLAMPNSGVRRYAAALQSLVSAGARDRLARAEEPVVRRLSPGGRGFELLVPQSQEIILRAHRDRPSALCSPRESDTPHERDRGFESAFLQR